MLVLNSKNVGILTLIYGYRIPAKVGMIYTPYVI
jgi:hypothetical protein